MEWISCHFATFYMFLEQEVALFTYLTYFHIYFPSLCIFPCLLQIPAFVDCLFMQIEDSPLSLNCFPKQPRAPQAHPTFLVRGGKFAGGLDFSGELKKAPLIFLQHFLSPPENKQAKSMPPWKQTSKMKAPMNCEQQNQMSDPPKNSHF